MATLPMLICGAAAAVGFIGTYLVDRPRQSWYWIPCSIVVALFGLAYLAWVEARPGAVIPFFAVALLLAAMRLLRTAN